ncbi:hypothetical protein Dimus_034761 [Dionaea muscipula]
MEGSFIVTDKQSASSSYSNSAARVICRVCQKQFSQYTCPRCNTRYCSLQCYKSHSLTCTESFMRENVLDEFRVLKPDDGTKKKMLEILKRFYSEEDIMEADEPTLSEKTIQKALSGGEIEYDDLSSEEKELFRRAMASGELSKMIEPWDPWWLKPSARSVSLNSDGSQLIQLLGRQERPESSSDIIPAGPEAPLLPINKLTTIEPSPLLSLHLVDILYSYCFTLRLHNGDWQSDTIGAAISVLSISLVLGRGGMPETVREVVSHCLEQTCSPALRDIGGLQFGLSLLDDITSLLLLGGSAIICGLCDLQRLIQAAESCVKSEKPRRVKRAEIKSQLRYAERKIYFVMCWVHEQAQEVWSSVATIVKAEKAASALDLEHTSPVRTTLNTEKRKTAKNPKALIEEVP